MSKKGLKFGIASAAVIGAGAAVLQAKNKSEAKKAAETTTVTSEPKNDYRNTERGKDKKNSKGIYYTNGNYEAFARPEKPEGVDEKSAYLVGSGLAALAAACFLVRDGQMKGDHIHILEAMDIAGGAEQKRPELLPVPCNEEPRRGCPYRRKVQPEPERLHGDHETLHDKRRGSVRQDDRGCFR